MCKYRGPTIVIIPNTIIIIIRIIVFFLLWTDETFGVDGLTLFVVVIASIIVDVLYMCVCMRHRGGMGL